MSFIRMLRKMKFMMSENLRKIVSEDSIRSQMGVNSDISLVISDHTFSVQKIKFLNSMSHIVLSIAPDKVDFFINLYNENKFKTSSYVLITPSGSSIPISFDSLPGIQIEKKSESTYEVFIYLANSQDEP